MFLRQVSPADFTRRDSGFVENSKFLRSPDCRPHYSMQGTQVMSPVTCGVVSAGHILAYTGPSVREQIPHKLINPFLPLREVSIQESKSNQECGELPQEGGCIQTRFVRAQCQPHFQAPASKPWEERGVTNAPGTSDCGAATVLLGRILQREGQRGHKSSPRERAMVCDCESFYL